MAVHTASSMKTWCPKDGVDKLDWTERVLTSTLDELESHTSVFDLTHAFMAKYLNPHSLVLKSSLELGSNSAVGCSRSTHGYDGQISAYFWKYVLNK